MPDQETQPDVSKEKAFYNTLVRVAKDIVPVYEKCEKEGDSQTIKECKRELRKIFLKCRRTFDLEAIITDEKNKFVNGVKQEEAMLEKAEALEKEKEKKEAKSGK